MMVRRLLRFALLLALLMSFSIGTEAVAYKSAVQVMPDDDGDLPMHGAGGSQPDGDFKISDLKDWLASLMPFLEKMRLELYGRRVLGLSL
jgi:hypothetical protein